MNQYKDNDQPLDRAFGILEVVASAKAPLSITDLSAILSLPAPTVHRLVGQLLKRDLLKREFDNKRVLPGPRLIEFSSGVLEASMLADRPHVVLLSLANQLGEHCQVGIVAEGEVLYVDTAKDHRTFGLQFRPGRRAPLHCTSIGKLYLASLPVDAFKHWLHSTSLLRYTANTIVDRDALAVEVDGVREQGWSVSTEEFVEGVVGCAVPIRKNDRFMAGLGIAAPTVRLSATRLDEILPLLQNAARAIASELE